MINDWKNKKVAVLGLGVEGLSSVRFLVKKGARVTVLDRKNKKELIPLLRHSGDQAKPDTVWHLAKPETPESLLFMVERDAGQASMTHVEIVGGKDYLKNLNDFDIIFRSPGIKRNLPEILKAEKNGVIITSQTKIFFDLCPCPIIGVTGTKGKGTTATLIYEMLKKQGFDVYLGGNIGEPPLNFLDKLKPRSWVILELSSFQLQDLTKSPHIAVMLMVTQEHLDYHKDVQEYIDAKRNLLRFQQASDFAIINRDYPASNESDIHTSARVYQVSREREVEEGCFVKDGKVLLRMSFPRKRESGSPIKSGMTEVEIISTKGILLPGKHNLENVCASVMVATILGVSKENIVKVLKTFKGLEHRLELVAEIGGVKYYDDSFSTTPETAIAAIKAFENPEILILGGSSKGSDFTELGRVISSAKNIKVIIGIGVEWPKIKLKINPSTSSGEKLKIVGINKHLRGGRMDSSEVDPMGTISIEGCKDMHEIVQVASKNAQHGDVVLLSPACASFDMFKNYKDRGEQFKREVNNLKS